MTNRVAYLREIARFINECTFSKRLEVDDNGNITDGGILVLTERLKDKLDVLRKELSGKLEKAEWLIGLWEDAS